MNDRNPSQLRKGESGHTARRPGQPPGPLVSITMHLPGGSRREFTFPARMLAGEVANAAAKRVGLPVADYELEFRGRPLAPTLSLADNNVRDDDELDLHNPASPEIPVRRRFL